MRPSVPAAVTAAALAIGVLAATVNARQDPLDASGAQVFRTETDVVMLHVNVFDGDSDAVPNLPKEVFRIFENDQPQTITFFSNADVPVAAGLVVDGSSSMIARRRMVVAGAAAFADASHPADELFTIHFNENVRFGLPETVPFTTNRMLLRAAVRRFPARGRTALFDAVAAGLDHLETATRQKRVLVILSDGADNASRLTEEEMLDRARRSDAIIYAVSSDRIAGGESDRGVLRRLADATGGLAFFPRSSDRVVDAFTEIAGNIRRGYTLGYVPSAAGDDGAYRRVRVTVDVPGRDNLQVRSRDGYTASAHR